METETYIHPNSDVQTDSVGIGTKIWQYCVVLKKAVIGRNSNICAQCFIENEVVVGDNVTIKCGVQLWDGTIIEDNVCIGPNVTFTNDKFPRSQNPNWIKDKTVVCKGASIGANSTILPGLIIGEGSLIGAGSVVTKDVLPFSLVIGNPAKFVRFI